MKTNEELLKFYGIELNKKYIITDVITDVFNEDYRYYIGKKFKVVIKDDKKLAVHIPDDTVCKDYYVGLLNYVSYEPCPNGILDKTEKDYLRNIIKPFMSEHKIEIEKCGLPSGDEYIRIKFYRLLNSNEHFMDLPYFSKRKMYKGMKKNKYYTPEELGL